MPSSTCPALPGDVWLRVIAASVAFLRPDGSVAPDSCLAHQRLLATLGCTCRQLRDLVDSPAAQEAWQQAAITARPFNWAAWRPHGRRRCEAMVRWLTARGHLVWHLHLDLCAVDDYVLPPLLDRLGALHSLSVLRQRTADTEPLAGLYTSGVSKHLQRMRIDQPELTEKTYLYGWVAHIFQTHPCLRNLHLVLQGGVSLQPLECAALDAASLRLLHVLCDPRYSSDSLQELDICQQLLPRAWHTETEFEQWHRSEPTFAEAWGHLWALGDTLRVILLGLSRNSVLMPALARVAVTLTLTVDTSGAAHADSCPARPMPLKAVRHLRMCHSFSVLPSSPGRRRICHKVSCQHALHLQGRRRFDFQECQGGVVRP